MAKIEQIERENARLARGIGDEEDPTYDMPKNKMKRNQLDVDDQRIINDAVDRALHQYESAKMQEELEYEMLKKQEEERIRLLQRPSPEEILYMPITEKELFENITSLPPVSKPFRHPDLVNLRGHNQLNDYYQPKAKPQDEFKDNGFKLPINEMYPKRTPPPQKPLVSKDTIKGNIVSIPDRLH